MNQSNPILLLATILMAGSLLSAQTHSTSQKTTHEVPVTKAVAPNFYPQIARQKARTEEKVIVKVEIDADGHVAFAEGIEGNSILRSVALSAARRWRFSPASDESKRFVELTFVFRKVAKLEEAETTFKPPYEVDFAVSDPDIYN